MGKAALHRICGKGCLALVFSLFNLLTPIQAQEVASNPSGFYTIDLLGNSDTIVSFPYTRPPAASGIIESINGNEVVIEGHGTWADDQFVYAVGSQPNTYFLFVRDGLKEGHYYGITDNTVNQVTVDLTDNDLTGVAAGDRVHVIPYWTLGTLFPQGKGVHESTSPSVRQSEVLFKSVNFIGINPSIEKTFYFYADHWRQFGKLLTAVYDDTPMLPDAFLIVRHNVASSTVLKISGQVVMSKWAALLRSNTSTKQDNVVGLPRPVAVSLDNSGLIDSGAFTPSTIPSVRTDELLVYDNTVVGKNKSPSATYFYFDGAWRQFGKLLTFDAGSALVFTPGAGIVIRKNVNAGATAWVNTPSY